MKYKVILYNDFGAGHDDTAGNFTFYTYDQANKCATAWSDISAAYRAYLWNGVGWETR